MSALLARARRRRSTTVAVGSVLLAGLTAQLSGCHFAGVLLHNAPWYFRTPRPAPRADTPLASDAALGVQWVGHATVLVQLHDKFILTDPVFTELVGGFSRRLVAPGLAASALPDVTAVLVSHRHFDHLSRGSFPLIEAKVGTVLTPEGAAEDVPSGPYRTRELASWQTWEHEGLRVTAVPVVHDGARLLVDRHAHPRAFTGYVVEYRGLTVYFPGDTAYRQDVFQAVARAFPRIDLALLPVGPVEPVEMMLPNHLNPEQALQALQDLGAARMVPIHFGTYLHSYDEPGAVEARLEAAIAAWPELRERVFPLQIGERRTLLHLDDAPGLEVDSSSPTSPAAAP
jgi:L-ascorbate metabolism protein UlaG (beta-lactamase superfamily)